MITLPKSGREPKQSQNFLSINFEKYILKTVKGHIEEKNLLHESQFECRYVIARQFNV